MSNQVLRVIILVGALFPFVVLGYKLFEKESLITAGLYAAMVIVLFGTVLVASRVGPASDSPREPRDQ